MDKTKKQTIKIKNSTRIMHAVLGCVILVFLAVVSYRGSQVADEYNYYRPLMFEGRYSIDGGQTFKEFKDIKEITAKRTDELIMQGHVIQEQGPGKYAFLYVADLDVVIYKNGQVQFESKDRTKTTWGMLLLDETKVKNDIEIRLKSNHKRIVNTNIMNFFEYSGVASQVGIIKHMLYIRWIYVLMNILVLGMGISMIPYYVEVKRNGNMQYKGVLTCAFMMMAGASGNLVDRDFLGMFYSNGYLLSYLETLLKIVTGILMMNYLYRYLKREKHQKVCRIFTRGMIIAVIVYALTVIISNNQSMAEVFANIVDLYGFGVFVLEIIMLYKERQGDEKGAERMVLISSVMLIATFAVEMGVVWGTGVRSVHIFEAGLFLFAGIQWYIVATENFDNMKKIKEMEKLEKELGERNMQTIISQVQPHFMFNALGTIRALCTRNPIQARKAIDYLSRYLRTNMDSINKKECIPFAKELEHVESYLYIEKIRFDELLLIEYDIQAKDFGIPALTLQTMVENAVKHGLLAKPEGGTLIIESRELEDRFLVRVIDDGVGFDINQPLSTERTHVGIENTRKRLEGMCGGTLDIKTLPGEGTIVTISIPKEDIKGTEGGADESSNSR